MKKAKKVLFTVFALAGIILFVPRVFAQSTHGNFADNTAACAACHVTHASNFAKLLKDGPTETHFCYICHGQGAPGAPYDIQLGRTKGYVSGVGYVWYPSTAGGFEGLMVPDVGKEYSVTGSTYNPVTSRHNVWGYVNETGPLDPNDAAGDLFIPGSTSALTDSGLKCTSCHDPHTGGNSPKNYVGLPKLHDTITSNPRLLRKDINGKTGLTLMFRVTTVDTGVYRVTEYIEYTTYGGLSNVLWCGSCHDKFNNSTSDRIANSGHAEQSLGKWRHPVDMHTEFPPGANSSVDSGTPAQTNGNLYFAVACLTCHRAHSTVATMDNVVDWQRSEGGTGSSSALLRMDRRDICYNCHREGQYNSWQDTRFVPYTCATCHPDDDGSPGHVIIPGTFALCHNCHA